MKTLKSIINAVLILLMAIYGLAMLTWKAFWTEDFSLFLKKAALLTFVPSALNIFLQLGTTNHLVMDFSTSVWLFLVSLACDAIRLRKGQTAVK